MTEDPEVSFKRELDTFARETDKATRFLYAYLAIKAAMGDREPVRDLLNDTSLFWGTILDALQLSAFIALGRVFDQDKKNHNLDALLAAAPNSRCVFSKQALARRKQEASPDASEWLPAYLQRAHEASPVDFRRLRAHAKKWRSIYESNYRRTLRQDEHSGTGATAQVLTPAGGGPLGVPPQRP